MDLAISILMHGRIALREILIHETEILASFTLQCCLGVGEGGGGRSREEEGGRGRGEEEGGR